MKWTAEVHGVASSNTVCDITGGAFNPYAYVPCDHPGLYTLYDLNALGSGFGVVTVTVAGRNGDFRITEVDYSLNGVFEPSTLLLLATAALVLLVSRSRRIDHNFRLRRMRRDRQRGSPAR
jgi:hypothetical protein